MSPASQNRPALAPVAIGQLSVAVTLSAIAWFWRGYPAALSALLGGMVCLIPGLYFAWRAFRYWGTYSIDQMVRSLYIAQTVKFGLTGIMFAGVFITVRPLDPAFFLPVIWRSGQ